MTPPPIKALRARMTTKPAAPDGVQKPAPKATAPNKLQKPAPKKPTPPPIRVLRARMMAKSAAPNKVQRPVPKNGTPQKNKKAIASRVQTAAQRAPTPLPVAPPQPAPCSKPKHGCMTDLDHNIDVALTELDLRYSSLKGRDSMALAIWRLAGSKPVKSLTPERKLVPKAPWTGRVFFNYMVDKTIAEIIFDIAERHGFREYDVHKMLEDLPDHVSSFFFFEGFYQSGEHLVGFTLANPRYPGARDYKTAIAKAPVFCTPCEDVDLTFFKHGPYDWQINEVRKGALWYPPGGDPKSASQHAEPATSVSDLDLNGDFEYAEPAPKNAERTSKDTQPVTPTSKKAEDDNEVLTDIEDYELMEQLPRQGEREPVVTHSSYRFDGTDSLTFQNGPLGFPFEFPLHIAATVRPANLYLHGVRFPDCGPEWKPREGAAPPVSARPGTRPLQARPVNIGQRWRNFTSLRRGRIQEEIEMSQNQYGGHGDPINPRWPRQWLHTTALYWVKREIKRDPERWI